MAKKIKLTDILVNLTPEQAEANKKKLLKLEEQKNEHMTVIRDFDSEIAELVKQKNLVVTKIDVIHKKQEALVPKGATLDTLSAKFFWKISDTAVIEDADALPTEVLKDVAAVPAHTKPDKTLIKKYANDHEGVCAGARIDQSFSFQINEKTL